MIPAIWPISLVLEAALAVLVTRRGGFPAFRRFLWFDVATQIIEMFTPGRWYWLAQRPAEVAGIVLLCFVVRECVDTWSTIGSSNKTNHLRVCPTPKQGKYGMLVDSRLIALAALIAIPAHLYLAASVPWSRWASGIWQAVALSHSLMALFLFASMATARWTVHGALLALWLLADAVLFYVAPVWPVGMAVLWLNAVTWAVWIGATRFIPRS